MNKSESVALKHYLWLNNLRGKQASGVFKEEHFSLYIVIQLICS